MQENVSLPALPQYQKNWCINIMNKLDKKAISEPFKHKEESDQVKGFYSEKDNIDLETIRNKLQDNKYDTVIEFGCDVRQVFYNALDTFQPTDHRYMMAHELQDWFEKKFNNFPRTAQEKWYMKLNKTRKKIKKMLEEAKKANDSK